MKGYEGLAKAIVAEGVDTVFGVLGGGVLDLCRVLADKHGVRFVATRHEEVAVGMADGYSRATGKVGVAIVCYGPGMSNAGAPMIAARMNKSKVVVIAGGLLGVNRHFNMSFDELPFLKSTIGSVEELSDITRLDRSIRDGFAHARLGRGPVALHFSSTEADLPDDWAYRPAPCPAPKGRLAPAAEEVEEIIARVRKAKRPVVLAGKGAYAADAREDVLALAEKIGALTCTTLAAKCWLDGTEFDLGVAGGFSPQDTVDMLMQADLVIALGATLNQYTLRHHTYFRKAEIVQVTLDPGAIGDHRPVEQAVIADAKATAQAIIDAIEPIERPAWRGAAIAEKIAAFDRWRGLDTTERKGLANPRKVIDVLEEKAPADRILAVDIGLMTGVPMAHLSIPGPSDVIFPWMLGRIGCCLPLSMGAAIGRPDRLVTAFVGDGGLMASFNSLDTLATLGVPLLLMVMDDDGLGAERRLFQINQTPSTVADHTTPDLVKIGETLGLSAYRVHGSEELRDEVDWDRVRSEATLIQVKIDPAVPTDEIDAAFFVFPTIEDD